MIEELPNACQNGRFGPESDRLLIRTAALLHDTGYLEGRKNMKSSASESHVIT